MLHTSCRSTDGKCVYHSLLIVVLSFACRNRKNSMPVVKFPSCPWFTLALVTLTAFSSRAGDVVISEIMFHAAPAVPESNAWEWVELCNKGTGAVSLAGWKFSQGISFTFTNATLAPGGCLVVASDRAAFNARYPAVANVLGNWSGSLGNNGETIQLENATGGNEDTVHYSAEGDWALRVAGPNDLNHFGWKWFSEADGLGKSLELMNLAMPNQHGQNWRPSVAAGGTPGAPNSVRTNDIAPLIVEAVHSPLVPSSSSAVTVTATILDEQTNGVTATLFYRNATTTTPPAFSSLPMIDDGGHGDGIAGDRVFGASIPAQANNTVIEFYIQAADAGGRTRTYPAAAQQTNLVFAQTCNMLYMVDDTPANGAQPLYRIILTETERQELNTIGTSAVNSDAEMNGSFITTDGVSTEVRYTCSFRNRGHGSRSARPNNIRVNIPDDNKWGGVRALNLNSRFPHVQVFGSTLFQKAGLPTAFSRPVQVRLNNTGGSGGTPAFGVYAHNEELSSEFVANHFPTDSGGNCYRGNRIDSPSYHADFTYLGPAIDSCSPSPNCYTNLYFKQNNNAQLDYSDIIELCRVLSDAGLTGTQYLAEVNRVLDLDGALLYFAVNTLVDNSETSLANGNGDDYSMYRGTLDPRMKLMGYDTDTIVGQGDSAGSTTASLFRMTSGTATMLKLMNHPEITPRYFGVLKRLAESTFAPAQFNPFIDRVLGGFVDGTTINAMKTWNANRASYVLSQIPTNLTATSPLPVVSNFFYTTTATASLSGRAHAIDTRVVTVNGFTSVWNHVAGRWTNNAVALTPGINRALVQTYGTNGTELARTTADIWFDDGSVASLSGTLGNTTLTAAGGPYEVTGDVVIPAGVTLEIQPGTTLYVSAGVTITVNGVLSAEGSELQHIRFTRSPGSSASWGSLDFINATNESILAFVDIDSCAGTTLGGQAAEIHVNNSRVFFDHLVFANVPAQAYLSFDASSFIVQNSVFPTFPWATSAPTMLQGINGLPVGGYGIFRDNYFGRTFGFNDTIDFTGGQRPGAILQVINNVFDGASDDQLDLDSTDAWIEGNIFLHAHRDPNRTDDARDTSSAISGGTDFAGQFPEWTIINNLFYDVDHAWLNKGGATPGAGRVIFVNNTLVHVNKESGGGLAGDIAAFDFTDNGVALPHPSYGAGAYIAGNIIWDCPALTANYNASNHTVIMVNNLLPVAWAGPGSNNVVGDPHLNLSLIANVTNADWRTVQAALAPKAGSPALGTGLGGFDKGGLNPRGLLLFGEPAGVTHRTTATLTVAPGGTFNWGTNPPVPPYLWGYTHYKWNLDNGPWSAEIPITTSPTISLSGLANGPHTVYVSGRSDAGYYQDDPSVYPPSGGQPAHVTASRTWTVDPSLSRLVLSEILARNTSGSDLVELQNVGGADLDLTGYGLSDNPADPFKFRFAAGPLIEPGDYLVLLADDGSGGGIHLGFGLDGDGGRLGLYDAGGSLLDEVNFGPQLADQSIARLPDGTWNLAVPTFGAPNLAAPSGDPRLLKINEWMASGLGIYGDDFIELYNPDSLPVNVGGHYLSDAPQGSPTKHQFMPLSFIPGSGHSAFIADGDAAKGTHLNFKLAPDWGQLALFGPDLKLIDCLAYNAQSAGVSEGRQPSGGSTLAFFNTPTPGGPNPGSSGTSTIVVSNTVVNLIDITNKIWRYDNSGGTNLSATWNTPGFDDSSWAAGNGLFGFETTPGIYPYPFNTTVPAPNQAGGKITVYYRAHFSFTNQSGFALYTTNYLDDGAVWYLNGVEIDRLRVPAGQTYSTSGQNQTAEGVAEVRSWATNIIVPGDNVIAVEVHQSGATSTDAVFGMSLAAVRSVTNILTTSIAVVLNEVLANNSTITNADGTKTDSIELYNPSTNSTDLSDMSLTDDVTLPRKWVIPSGVSLVSGAYLVIRCDDGAPASTNSGPMLNTGFGMNAAGDEVYIYDAPARGGSLIDAITFGRQAEDYPIGRVPNGTGPWVLTLPTPGTANVTAPLGNVNLVRINEWMANPKSGDNDYFELFNPNTLPVAIGGLYLTDDLTSRTKFQIAPRSFIGSFTNGFAKFIADSLPLTGPNHVNFSLSAGGESLGLFPASGAAIDAYTFGAQASGVSEGRLPDGSTNVVSFIDTPTPGESNFLPLDNVVINEILTHTDPPLEDAVELFNQSPSPVDIGGWYLSDSASSLRKYRIPDNTVIPSGGFAVFYEYQFNALPGFFPSFSFSSAHGDQVYLSAADATGNFTGYRDKVDYGAAANGVSFGRYEKSTGYDYPAMSARSLGADAPASVAQFRTGTGLANPYPKVGPVVIGEVMYHPPDVGTNDNLLDEFIELRNITAAPVSLFHTNFTTNSWKLRDAVDFVFASNTVLAANGTLLVVSFSPTNAAQLSTFRTKFGVSPTVPIFGPYSGKLDNSSESVELARPDDPQAPPASDAGFVPYLLVDQVRYKDTPPWATLADGSTNGVGYSLQRVSLSGYGNDATNWIAGTPTPGAATGAAAQTPPAITVQPSSVVTNVGSDVLFSVTASGASLAYQWRFNGVDIQGETNSILQRFLIQTNHQGRYSVRVSNPAGAARSINAILSIQSPPVINQPPQNQVVAAGSTATFTVGASGAAPLRFQWRKNGANMANVTNASLVLVNAQLADQANYLVVVTNSFGSVTSAVATLTINAAPAISAQPQSLAVNQGDNASFSVTAGGSAPLRHQWRFNGASLPNETNTTLLLANVVLSQAGGYTVVITNGVGSITSVVAQLTIIALPSVTVVATDASAAEAGPDSGTFTVTRSTVTNSALTVNVSFSGTASNGSDYSTLSSPVTIPASAASATVTVTPIDDALLELPETVILTLVPGAGYTLGAQQSATITIGDNDNQPPVVAVTNPPAGTLYLLSPTNVVISATASDSDGSITKVEFFRQATNKLGELTNAPFTFTWTNAAAGSNALTAVATDNFGARGTSAPVSVVLNAQPAVSITSPANGSTISGTSNVTITVNASDADGAVTLVEFYEGANLVGNDNAAPFSLNWSNVAQGSYTLTARATDDRGAVRVSAGVTVTFTTGGTTGVLTNTFANQVVVGGLTNTVAGSNVGADKENNEPRHGERNGGASVWITWQAPASGPAVVDTIGSSFDTLLGVYTGTAVNALATIASNNDISGQIMQSRVTFNAVAGTLYRIAVDGRFAETGNIQLHFGLPNLTVPPSITAQPQNRTVALGANTTFSVTASGTAPLSYQWRRDGVAILGATATNLTLTNVTVANEAAYSVVVTNLYGSATSTSATLTVNDGLVVTYSTQLITLSNVWRYEQSGLEQGTVWREPDFDDSGWPFGASVLGFEPSSNAYPHPFLTYLSLSNGPNFTVTFYFRTHFTLTNDASAAVTLTASNLLDDGAVYYLNGTEAGRIRMNPGAVNSTTAASQSPPTEGAFEPLVLPSASRVPGDNVLAVEVHQSSIGSTDVAFGMQLDATVTFTNRPVIINAQRLGNGSFQGTLLGISGRKYAVDYTPELGSAWTPLVTYTNFTGSATFTDSDAATTGPRFYRGRLVP